MVATNKRLVLFAHRHNNCAGQACPDIFHRYFDYGVSTSFGFNFLSELQDASPADSCQAFSDSDGTTRDFFQVNAFLRIPSSTAAETLNDAAFVRQRNALYSRRKYHKHKLELLTLPSRAKTLEDQNAALKMEHARLTALWTAATAMVNGYCNGGNNSGGNSVASQQQETGRVKMGCV